MYSYSYSDRQIDEWTDRQTNLWKVPLQKYERVVWVSWERRQMKGNKEIWVKQNSGRDRGRNRGKKGQSSETAVSQWKHIWQKEENSIWERERKRRIIPAFHSSPFIILEVMKHQLQDSFSSQCRGRKLSPYITQRMFPLASEMPMRLFTCLRDISSKKETNPQVLCVKILYEILFSRILVIKELLVPSDFHNTDN